jgi:hypothetical protein
MGCSGRKILALNGESRGKIEMAHKSRVYKCSVCDHAYKI